MCKEKRYVFYLLGIIGRVIKRDLVCIAPFTDLRHCRMAEAVLLIHKRETAVVCGCWMIIGQGRVPCNSGEKTLPNYHVIQQKYQSR